MPWLTPSFTWREWVAQGGGPPGADGVVGELAGDAADVAGVAAGAALAEDSDAALVLVFPPLLEVSVQPVASTAAQVSAIAGNTRRTRSWVGSITIPSC